MTDETLDLEEWLVAQAREVAGENPGEHPTIESISSYHAGELTVDDSQKIQQHMATCHECTRLLLAFADALTEDLSSSGPADRLDVEEDWRELRARIDKEREPSVQVVLRPVQILTRQWRATTYALAALLCVAVIGLSIYVLRQNLGTTTKSSPIFVPSASMARSVALVKKVEIDPRDEKDLNFILEAPTRIAFSGYSLEVRDAQGRIVLRSGSVERQLEGFILTVSPRVLTEGRFEVEVQGIENEGTTIVGKYWIDIDYR